MEFEGHHFSLAAASFANVFGLEFWCFQVVFVLFLVVEKVRKKGGNGVTFAAMVVLSRWLI